MSVPRNGMVLVRDLFGRKVMLGSPGITRHDLPRSGTPCVGNSPTPALVGL